jgi:FtsH-binding integral membrane protein
VLYRKTISHRNLLEWTSAQAMKGRAKAQTPMFLLSMSLASLFSVLAGWAVLRWRSENFFLSAPWLILWFGSVAFAWWLIRRPSAGVPAPRGRPALSAKYRAAHLALFHGLRNREEFLATARQLSGLLSESIGHAD